MSRGYRITRGVADSTELFNSGMKALDDTLTISLSTNLDLIETNDAQAEKEYIRNSECSYRRTVADIVYRFADRINSGEKLRVLEIGSYLGVVSIALSRIGFSVTALDIPEFMRNPRLRSMLEQESVTPVAANLADPALPFDDRCFDLVIMCETLEHLNFNPLPVFSEISRLLKQGGMLYLSLPNLGSLVNRAKLLSGRSIHNPVSDYAAQLSGHGNMIVGIHWREYTCAEVSEMLHMSGFRIESHYCFTTNRASLPARLIYLLFPSLQGNQTVMAVKEKLPAYFHPAPGRGR